MIRTGVCYFFIPSFQLPNPFPTKQNYTIYRTYKWWNMWMFWYHSQNGEPLFPMHNIASIIKHTHGRVTKRFKPSFFSYRNAWVLSKMSSSVHCTFYFCSHVDKFINTIWILKSGGCTRIFPAVNPHFTDCRLIDTFVKTLKNKTYLNCTLKFISYSNRTVHVHFRTKIQCLLWESHETHEYIPRQNTELEML